jgi:HK97 family phage major capsid protein
MTAAGIRSARADLRRADDALDLVSITGGEPAFARDPMAGFASRAEFFGAVLHAGVNRSSSRDERLRYLAAGSPSTSGGEVSGVDGGFAIPVGVAGALWDFSGGEPDLLSWCSNSPIASNSALVPNDQTPPWSTSSVRAYWQGELQSTQTKPKLSNLDLRMKKLLALIPVSDELVADGGQLLSDYLTRQAGTSIRWKTNEAILWGAGALTPLGAYKSGAALTVAKESGQAASTVLTANLTKMIGSLTPGSLATSIWLCHHDAISALINASPAGYPMVPAPQYPAAVGLLLGRALFESAHASSFSAAGDILLCDLSMYQCITKVNPIDANFSLHCWFDLAVSAFRFSFRIDGAPVLSAPVTEAKGSNTLSPFIQLGSR